MPELPPIRLWWIFAPWKYHRRWARFVGFFCMITVLANVTAYIFDVESVLYWALSFAALMVVLILDMVRMQLDNRRFRRTQKILNLWGQVIEGKVRLEDLTPEQQEEIAVQRSKVYTERKP